ncbi:hypothetical protein Smp_135880 [Schistosoma mansoni]|uniref:hypothetical protein n=1 Tax=Schistosoma mansoni TaxID=6183 RepID=UPI00022DCABC|nr:hypothetical protein Smp_135880 [Schistosoma mansoni]|eukprot:XP_018654968.1 hypothetical protein Smp_135880 [Schistosoma mansoni]
MGVLGLQLATTLVAASVLSKVISFFSFTHFLIAGLTRYAVPTDQQLLEASGNCKTKIKGKRRRNDLLSGSSNGTTCHSDTFYFPRSTTIHLKQSHVSTSDIAILPLYSSHQWLVDFTVCASCVYLINEVAYNCIIPWYEGFDQNQTTLSHASSKQDSPYPISLNVRINLSLVWMTLSLWFTIRTLVSLTAIYFQPKNDATKIESRSPKFTISTALTNTPSGECILILAAGFFFLVAATLFLSLDGTLVDFGLQAAYGNLTFGEFSSSRTPIISWGAFHFILAVIACIIGSLFVYPGIKFGKIYLDTVKQCPMSVIKRIILHLNFICPIIPILLWLIPITDHISNSLITLTHSNSLIEKPFLITIINFVSNLFMKHLNSIRLIVSLAAYLNSAQDKLDRFTHEAGQTSNKEVQRLVASIFYCLNLVALQYISPCFLFLCLLCLYKNLSGLSWLPYDYHQQQYLYSSDTLNVLPSFVSNIQNNLTNFFLTDFMNQNNFTSWSTVFMQARYIFSQIMDHFLFHGMIIARGIFGFLVWWTLTSWQLMCFLGLAYHRFANE